MNTNHTSHRHRFKFTQIKPIKKKKNTKQPIKHLAFPIPPFGTTPPNTKAHITQHPHPHKNAHTHTQ